MEKVCYKRKLGREKMLQPIIRLERDDFLYGIFMNVTDLNFFLSRTVNNSRGEPRNANDGATSTEINQETHFSNSM